MRIRAIALLSLAIDSAAIVPGGRGPVTAAELNDAADDMKTLAEHCLDVNFGDVQDLVAHINNAAVLLRLCDRHDESEALLLRGLSIVGDEPQLRRLLALSQSAQDRDGEALTALAGDTDPENRLLGADLQASTGDIAGALQCALAIETKGCPSDSSGFAGVWWGSIRSVSMMRRISRPPSRGYACLTRPTSRRDFWRSGGRGKRPRTRRSSTTS